MLERLTRAGTGAGVLHGRTDALVVVLGVLLLVVLLAPVPTALATPVVLLGGSVVPGWAVVRHLPGTAWERAGLTVAVSLALLTGTGLVLVWTGAWRPAPAGAVVVLVALASVLLTRAPQQRREAQAAPARSASALLALALAALAVVVLWFEACLRTDTDDLSTWGLLGALPATWYAALALVLLGLLASLARPVFDVGATAVWTATLALVLYGTAPLVHDAPRYAYVYKHLGVTRYVLERGTVDPGVDIYHRWPGMFALGAWFTETSGLGDPTRFAAWAETYFGVVALLLVLAVATAVSDTPRTAWTATALFLAANWIGQNYYAPQALALVLMLAVLLVVVVHLPGTGNGVARRASALGDALLRRGPVATSGPRAPARARQGATAVGTAGPAAVVVLLFAPLVASHQLTPYVVAGVVAALAVCGLVRPWWLPVLLLGLCAAYLVPNADYVSGQYGIISSLNPLTNVSTTVTTYGSPSPAKALQQQASVSTILGVWALAALGVAVLARRRGSRDVLPLALLAFLPVLTVAVQSYGGEGRLRVYLYSLPFCSVAIASLLQATARRGRPARALPAAVLVALVGLFLLPYFGRDDTNGVSPGEVASADWVYANVPAGNVLLQAVPGWPSRYGANYGTYSGPVSEATPNLLLGTSYATRSLRPAGEADVTAAATVLGYHGSEGVLIFSDNMQDFARANQLFGADGLRSLERAVVTSRRFRLVFENEAARVYRLQR